MVLKTGYEEKSDRLPVAKKLACRKNSQEKISGRGLIHQTQKVNCLELGLVPSCLCGKTFHYLLETFRVVLPYFVFYRAARARSPGAARLEARMKNLVKKKRKDRPLEEKCQAFFKKIETQLLGWKSLPLELLPGKLIPGFKKRGIAIFTLNVIGYCTPGDFEFFSLQWLADKIGISESFLTRCFKDLFKSSPLHSIQEQKMNLAKELLIKFPRMSIDQVAAELHYSSGNYFIKAFKKINKVTPHRFRLIERKERKRKFKLKRLARKIERSLNQTIYEETAGKYKNAVYIHGGMGKRKNHGNLDFFL
jgi:AraC-like DNA-binding protein